MPTAALPRAELTRVPLGRRGGDVVAAGDSVWAGDASAVQRVDPGSGRVVGTVQVADPDEARWVGVGPWDGDVGAAVYSSSDTIDLLVRIDPDSGRITDRLDLTELRPHVHHVTGSARGIWYISSDAAVLVRLDPETGAVLATTDLPPAGTPTSVGWGFGALAAADDAVWVTMPYDGTLVRVDAATNEVTARVCVSTAPTGGAASLAYLPVSVAAGSVWVSVPETNEVVRVDPSSGAVVARIALPDNANPSPDLVTEAGGQVWVASGFEGYVIDPATNQVTSGQRFLTTPESGSDRISPIVEAGGALWTRETDLGYLVRAGEAS